MLTGSDGACGLAPPSDATAQRGSLLLVASILIPLVGMAIFLQLNTYPNHDVAWVLWGTREMLMGAKWGIDIIEPNPPLAWFLSIPSTLIAMWAGLPLDWTFRTFVALAGVLSAGCFSWILRGEQSKVRCGVLCATAGVCLLLLPAREFGQREHLVAIAILPYLALACRRIEGPHQPAHLTAIAIGLATGLGLALKPYFLAVPLLVEIAVQILGRRSARLFRAENVAIGSIFALYAIELIVFDMEYLRDIVPLANSIYWSFDKPWPVVLSKFWPQILSVLPFMAIVLLNKDKTGIILSAAICGFAVSYLIQHKGYPYHLFPFSVASLILLAHLATSSRGFVRVPMVIALLAYFSICTLPALAWWKDNRADGGRTIEIERILNSIAAHSSNRRFLIVAVHPYPTFPVAIYTPARQVSRTNSHWFLPAVVQMRTNGVQRPDASAIERHAREFMLHDLATQPDLVLIDTNSARHTVSSNGFDYLAFFQESPAFRGAWKSYREIEPLGEYRQFVRVPQKVPAAGVQTS